MAPAVLSYRIPLQLGLSHFCLFLNATTDVQRRNKNPCSSCGLFPTAHLNY